MASMYAGLNGKIPEEPTAREAALLKELQERDGQSVASLTERINQKKLEAKTLAAKVKQVAIEIAACEILVRKALQAQGADAVRMHGYTWSEKFEPYPICEDPKAAIEYFRTHEMEDQLELTTSEINTRLKSFVKEEALNNELKIETCIRVDEATGEEREVTEVFSKVPGVRVYLKAGLSRVKASTTIKE